MSEVPFSSSTPDLDARFMRRALRLAMNGRGRVEPNPMVGCVLVKSGRVIGEGCHEQFGGPHAEPNALAACAAAGESPEGATAYVTLEPCCHANKKTPPCAPKLIEAKVARVVVGCLDPNPEVNGKGLAILRGAGIEVAGPVLEAEAKQLIALFINRVDRGGPYVTLKWAETADGKVAGPGGRRLQISGPQATRAVHELRSRCDAILIGSVTAVMDDPMLTPRDVPLRHRPLRVVLDRSLLLPASSQLVRTAKDWPTAVVSCSAKGFTVLEAAGVRVKVISEPGGIDEVMHVLRDELGVHGEVLVEPGPTLAKAFLASGHVDRVWVIRSPRRVNDQTAPTAAPVAANYLASGETGLESDRLTEYLNPDSHVFFGPYPSADFVLTSEAKPARAG